MRLYLRKVPLYVSFIFSFLWLSLMSAQVFEPELGNVEHNNDNRACWQVSIAPEPKVLKEAWIDYMDDTYDIKLKGMGLFQNKDVLTAEEIQFPKIGNGQVNFYTRVTEDNYGSSMQVFASNVGGAYLDNSNNKEGFSAMREIMEEFLKNYLPKYHQKMIAQTRGRIEELNKESNDLKEEIEAAEEEIQELQQKIEEMIDENEEKIEALNQARNRLEKRRSKLLRMQEGIDEF